MMEEKGRNVRRIMVLFLLLIAAGIVLFIFECRAEASALAAPKGFLANGTGDRMVLSWEPVRNADGYEIFEKKENAPKWSAVKTTDKTILRLSGRNTGVRYVYKVRAYKKKKNGTLRYGRFSKKSETTLPKQAKTTLRNFLKVAMAPVGSTMYIWGGGWNKADHGAGKDALRIGLNPQWREFAGKQTGSYDYRKYRYKRGYGLDCSGFVGWSVYNALHRKKGSAGEGYVAKAKSLARNYARNGWGNYKPASKVRDYKAGDIMSGSGHVYIVIGSCSDGSVVLVHSSPAGVQLCGTAAPSGKKNSKAVKLARYYMKRYYPSWYQRFPDCSRGVSYLNYNQFRWNVSGKKVMEDPDQYREKSAGAILKDLFH